MFFINPKHHGKTEIEAALKANPTVVIALDFLFWYAYGVQPEKRRMHSRRISVAMCPVER